MVQEFREEVNQKNVDKNSSKLKKNIKHKICLDYFTYLYAMKLLQCKVR